MASFQTLTVSISDRLGRLTLAQPDRLNPIGAVALRELAEAAQWFDQNGATVVLVSGAGRAFSAGFDLRELKDPGPDAMETPAMGAEMAESVASMAAVTIAAVQGPCVGGGFVLAMCCDLRLASDDAWFSLPEAELGIPLAWGGVPRFVREIGPARTTELVLTCRRVPAEEVLGWGVLNAVVPQADLASEAGRLAEVLLTRKPEVVATTKRQVHAAAGALIPTGGHWAGTEALLDALRGS